MIRDRFISGLASLAITLTLLAPVTDAWSHGAAPAVLDVMSGDVDASRLRLTVGLAEREDDGWRWVCPASWGGPETPLVANRTEDMVVFGADGMVALSGGAGVLVEGGGELTSASVRASATNGESIFILAQLDGEERLLRAGDGAPVVLAQLRENWQSLDVRNGAPLLGAVREGRLLVAEVRPTGTGVSETSYEVQDTEATSASLRVRGDRTFAVLSAPEDYRLFELIDGEAVERFASASFIHGPMPIGDELLAVSDGALWVLGEQARVLDDRVRYTCASWSPDASFVCAQTALFQVFEGGAATIPSFNHADLRPPLDPVGSCQGEWLDYAGHAGIELGEDTNTDPDPEAEPEPGSSPKSGCASATHAAPRTWLFLALVALCLGRTHPRTDSK